MAIANLPHSCLGLATVNFSPFLDQHLEIFRTNFFVNRKSRLVVPNSIITCARNGGHSLFPYSPTETRNSKRSLTTTHARRNNTSQTQSPAPPTPLPTDPALNPAANARPAATGGEVLVTGTGLSKTYDGIQFLFNDLDISVSRGQKVGLLGANGSGKSTLLKVLGGVEVADKGTVQQRKGTRIGYLAQDPILDSNLTVLDAVLAADTPVMNAVRNYERALVKQAAMLSSDSSSLRELEGEVQSAMDEMEALNAWDVAAEAEKLLEVLGVGFLDRKVGSLSGGQRKRVAMAATMLAKPELVILDEPTNHMDVNVIQWMERALSDASLTVLLVTHDRYFLDRICSEIVELEGGKAYRHTGNYSAFLAGKEARRVGEEAAFARVETTLRKETDWMRKQPKARSTKSRARIDRFYDLTARSERGPAKAALQLEVGEARLGSKVLQLTDASCRRGEKSIFRGFTYEFTKGERVGVVGKNGAGKSTFLDALTGGLPLEGGSREVGETVVIGYYTQQTPPIPDDIRVIDYVRQFGETIQMGSDHSGGFQGAGGGGQEAVTAVHLLERFGFSREKQYKWAGKLSGGEKRRLYLATILMQRPNVLLLDEPTNDLDLPTIQVLESFLESFEGSLLVVSHDRAFMDNVVQKLFVLEGDGQVKLFDGCYSDYLDFSRVRDKERLAEGRGGGAAAGAGAEAVAGAGAVAGGAGKEIANGSVTGGGGRSESTRTLSFMEKKEYKGLEAAIEKLAAQKTRMESALGEASAAGGGYDELAAQAQKVTALGEEIERKTERWLELAESAGD